jgi:hypothetical protein
MCDLDDGEIGGPIRAASPLVMVFRVFDKSRFLDLSTSMLQRVLLTAPSSKF